MDGAAVSQSCNVLGDIPEEPYQLSGGKWMFHLYARNGFGWGYQIYCLILLPMNFFFDEELNPQTRSMIQW